MDGLRSRVVKERRTSLSSPEQWLVEVFGGGATKSGAKVSPDTALTVSTVFACTRILAESVASLPLKLYRKTADGREEASDHPLFSLLKDGPNEGQTSFEWREMMQGHLALRGNGYSRVRRNSYFEVTAIEPIHPCDIQPRKLPSGRIVYDVKSETLLPTDVLHLRGLSTDGVCGLSPVRLMRESIGLALTTQEHGAKSFANGNRFPGILKAPGSVTPDQIKQIRDVWDSQRSGDNASKAPVVGGGLDWISVGMRNDEAEFLGSRRFEVEEIARAYRIPLHLLQSTEKTTTWGSGVEQLNLGFLNYTLQPWLVRWEQRLNTLLTEDERKEGLYFSFNLNALMRGDAKSRAEFYKIMREIRGITVNELREREELNDFPDAIGDNPREGFNGQGGGATQDVKNPAKQEQEAA